MPTMFISHRKHQTTGLIRGLKKMDAPITAVISAIAFGVVSIIIVAYLVREMYRYYSKKEDDNKE